MEEKIKDIHKIMVGVDDSDDAQLAFRVAMRRALDLNAELDIVSILESHEMNVFQALNTNYVHGQRRELEDHISQYKKIAEQAGVRKVNAIVAEGKPGEVIVKDLIPQFEPDLLVIGALAKEGIGKYFGSEAAYMSKYAPISVLVVR